MKTYSFAKVSARGYLTKADFNNKWIITDDLGLVISLSEKADKGAADFFASRQIEYLWLPLQEETDNIGYSSILEAVRKMLLCERSGKRIIVHCDFGNNRSRTVVEAFHYAKMGFHLEDGYKGYVNHLIYNSKSGYLPPLDEIEIRLQNMNEEID